VDGANAIFIFIALVGLPIFLIAHFLPSRFLLSGIFFFFSAFQ
jgi:hypothetical protein